MEDGIREKRNEKVEYFHCLDELIKEEGMEFVLVGPTKTISFLKRHEIMWKCLQHFLYFCFKFLKIK